MVSVIVPIYNTSAFLRQCVDSVLAQGSRLFELILVDDGSTDSSPDICREYAARDSRVKVISKPNGGVSSALNVGIELAQGDWVMIVDSDDVLWQGALEALCQAAEVSGCSLVAPRYSRRPEDLGIGSHANRIWQAEQLIAACLLQRQGTDNSMAGKLVKRSLYRELRFCEGSRYEDLDMFYRIYAQAGTLCCVDTVCYYYRVNNSGFMLSGGRGHCDVLPVSERIVEWSRGRGAELERAAEDRLFAAACTALRAADGNDTTLCKHAWQYVKQYRRATLRNSLSRRKNRIAAALSYSGRRLFVAILRCLG